MTATLFDAVKKAATKMVGSEVADASISVPTMFTSARREYLRDAAESAGLRIVHLASGPLLAAQAMKISGELSEPGLSVIVDVGASKTEISVVNNTPDGVREVRTVGSDAVNRATVRNQVVDQCLPIVRRRVRVVNYALRAKLAASAEASLTRESGPRVVAVDLGNGKQFRKEFTDRDVASASASVVQGVTKLISEAVTDAEKDEIGVVRCIGGGSMLEPIGNAIHQAFPNAEVRQLDPDEMIVCGANLDAAQRTNRLPNELRSQVTTVAPYSIGISVLGDVIFI
jgi:molecular chaperone DnaK (HSP70)